MTRAALGALLLAVACTTYLGLEYYRDARTADRQAVLDAFLLVERELKTYQQYLGDPVTISDPSRIYNDQAERIPVGNVFTLRDEQQYKTHLHYLPTGRVHELDQGLRYEDHLGDISGERVENQGDNAYEQQLGDGPTAYSPPNETQGASGNN